MAFKVQAVSGATEHVYDPKVTYRPVKFDPYVEGTTLSTQAQKAKKAWGQQKAYVYDGNPQPLRQEKIQAEKVLLRAVPNRDGREHITDTTAWPHAFHAQLTMKFDGKTYGGSGAMVGPHHLLTCGHNVYDADHKQWAEAITVYPALNDNHAPFGEVKVVRVYTFSHWTDRGDKKYDIALLVLNRSIGKFTGWGGLLCAGDAELSQEQVNIVGYPGDKGLKQMWGMKHMIQKITPEEFEYHIDTNSGQSGSAIWINKFGTPMILGVHTLGGDDANFGVRISQEKFREIVQKISKTYKLETIDAEPFASPRLQKPSLQAPSLPKQPQPDLFQPVAPIQAIKAPALPAWVFGAAEWNKYFGDVGVEPPLPDDIVQRLSELSANNVLVLIPATVNGQPFTLKTLGDLVQKPLQGHATKYIYFDLGEYVDQPAKSHWALLTRTVLEGSRKKLLKDQQIVLDSYSQKTKILYEAPTVLDATVCNFMEYVRSGTWLYGDNPPTYTWCQEKYNANYNLFVGGGSAAGLAVGNFDRSAHERFGVGGLRKSF